MERLGKRQVDILYALRDEGPMDFPELAREVGRRIDPCERPCNWRPDIRQSVKRLGERGLINRAWGERGWPYCWISNNGCRALEALEARHGLTEEVIP